jgi:iron complex outermembrane receptor protein
MTFTSLCRFLPQALVALLCFVINPVLAADTDKIAFDVPAGDAAQALKHFAQQAKREIVFPSVGDIQTNAVQGSLTVREGLDRLLAGTPLTALEDPKTGAFAIRRGAESPNAPRAARSSDRPQNQAANREDKLLELPTFEVSARRVIGTGESRAIFTLDSTQIEERPAGTDITLSLKSIPGVQVSTGDARGGSFSWELYMRGLTKEQIGFSLDGIPTGDARFNGGQPPDRFIDAGNIARIVVSKSSGEIGSPSRFALGGFMNFVTEDPGTERGTTIEAGMGSFDYQFAAARVDFGEITKGVTGYASYSHRENGNHAGPKSRSNQRDHFELKLLGKFGERTKIAVRASYNDMLDNDFNIISMQEYRGNPRSDRAGDEITGVPAVDIDYGGALGGSREDWLVYANAEFRVTDNIRLNFNPYVHSLRGESYRYQDRNRRLNDANPRAVTGYNALGGAIRPSVVTTRNATLFGGPADMRVTPRNRDRQGATGELTFENLGGYHTLRVGAWHENDEANEFRNFYPVTDTRQSIGYNRNALAYVEYERSSKLATTMFYAQDRISLLEGRLNFDLGATYIKTGYDVRSPLEYSTRVKFSQNSSLLPKAGVYFLLTDDIEVFAGAARNFSGLPEDVFLGSSAVISENDLTPITTDNMDAGVRYVSRNFALSLQGYYVDLKNTIGIVPLAVGATDVDDVIRGNVSTKAANLQGIENYGAEVTAYFKVRDFDLYAAYARQHARHKQATSAAEQLALALNGVIAGERVRDIPKDTFSATLGWEPDKQLRLTASFNYVGRRVGGHIIAPSFANPTTSRDKLGNPVSANQAIEVETIPAHTLVGFGLRYRPKAWSGLSLELNVDNAFDKTFIGSVSSATTTLQEFGVVGGLGYTLDRYFIGYPRTVTLSMRAEF